MKKLLICAALFFAPLSACNWTPIWDEEFDYETECLFYDAWNNEVVYGVPADYTYEMCDCGCAVIITHYALVAKPRNVLFGVQGKPLHVYLSDCLE